jgi:hypothetical protein
VAQQEPQALPLERQLQALLHLLARQLVSLLQRA